MNRPSKTVTSIGVVAFVIAAAMTGIAGLGGAMSGYDRLGLLFIGLFIGVFVLGWLLDRAARNALR
jgi:nicotinamide mononucleotide (NMN) deamidase PncC